MAPFQTVNIILGHRTKTTGSLGFSFQTDTSTNDHRVYHVESFAQPCGICAGDFIVGLNHQPLSHNEAHSHVAQKIKTIPRPFTLNVLRPQQVMVDDRPKLRQQHRDWFVGFCRKYRVERSVIEATLRLRRATTCVGKEDKVIGTGRNAETGHDGDHESITAKRHLIVCLRVMVKFIDDRMGVTSLSALAGFKLSDDEWMKLEFEVCNQANWNLVYFCHSSKNNLSAAPADRESPSLVSDLHNHTNDRYPIQQKLSVQEEIVRYNRVSISNSIVTDQNCDGEKEFWEPLPLPALCKRKRVPTPASHQHQHKTTAKFQTNGSVGSSVVPSKQRPTSTNAINPIHQLARTSGFAQQSGQTQHNYGCSVTKPNLTLGEHRANSNNESDSDSTSGSDNESDPVNIAPMPVIFQHHHGSNIHKVHHSQISLCTNTTQDKPMHQQHQGPSRNYTTDANLHRERCTGEVKLAQPQPQPHSYSTSQQKIASFNQKQQIHIHHRLHHQHRPPYQYQHQHKHQHQLQQRSYHHKPNVQYHHHHKDRARGQFLAQRQGSNSLPGVLGYFRSRCQSIVSSLNRAPQVAVP